VLECRDRDHADAIVAALRARGVNALAAE